MKTAVEWYNSKVIELMTQREQGNIDVLEFRNQLDLLFEQAKEMEKTQQAKEYLKGFKDGKEYEIKMKQLTFKSE
jgi:hypothetical protein